jgi:hypothetical protein
LGLGKAAEDWRNLHSQELYNLYHVEDLGIDGRIILIIDLKELCLECVDWIHLAEGGESGELFRTWK